MSNKENEQEEKLVLGLISIARQAEQGVSSARATIARLKRSLSDDGVAPSALREIGNFLSQDLTPKQMETRLLLAALFAHYPSSGRNRMGRAMQLLRKEGSSSLDARISALIEAPREELPHRLRQMVQILESKDIGLDWYALLADLERWDHPDRFVQLRWARECYVPFVTTEHTIEN
jgi:CRISPR system Cascade subunit CasB